MPRRWPQKKKRAKSRVGTTSNTYVIAGASSTNFILGTLVNIAIPTGPTKTFLIDYISAFIAFKSNFVQDPAFFLDFGIDGVGGQHAFAAERVPTTAPNPEGYQLYIISRRVKIAVDGGTSVTFSGQYMPADVGATLTIQFSGHFV